MGAGAGKKAEEIYYRHYGAERGREQERERQAATSGEKRSIVFLKKWKKNLIDKSEDYNIFFSSSFKCGKLSSGEYLYKKDNEGSLVYDQNQKLIIDDDFKEVIDDFKKFLKKEKINF